MSEVMHHIQCKKGDVGRYVLLPGDPGRVEKIAKHLDDARFVKTNREYVIYTGYLENEKVSVMSTGMGGPSTAIGLEELIKIGADTFIRVGTCGGIDPEIEPGTVIIPTGAIRKDGTGQEYVPIEFPAVPNFEVVAALKQASESLGNDYRLGVVECKDSFYGQHEPESMPTARDLFYKWEAWQRAGAIGSEMESSTLFIVSSVRRVRAGSILLLCRNLEREKKYPELEKKVTFDTKEVIETAIEGLRILIREERKR